MRRVEAHFSDLGQPVPTEIADAKPLAPDEYIQQANVDSNFAIHAGSNKVVDAGVDNPATADLAMQAAAAQEVANIANKEAQAATKTHEIAKRRLTPEVSRLNDMAQIEIWGTGGKTAGFVDPKTGEPLTSPIKGLIEEIREQEFEGTRRLTSAERDLRAQDKEIEIKDLVANGFELCQAKLVIDLRKGDEVPYQKLIAKHIGDGMSATEAEAKAKKLYATKDAQRLALIEKEGVFTKEEYDHARGGGVVDPTKPAKVLDPAEAKKRSQEDNLLKKFGIQFMAARDEYARLSAGRGRRLGLNREFTPEAIDTAREKYEAAHDAILSIEIERAKRAGMSNDELKLVDSASAAESALSLQEEIFKQRMIATGRAVLDAGGNLQGVQPKTGLGRLGYRFSEWWGRQDGKTGALKKAAVSIGVGVPAGAAGVAAGTVLLGPVLGGALGVGLGVKLAKAWAFHKVEDKATGRRHIQQQQAELINSIVTKGNSDLVDLEAHNDRLDRQTGSEVLRHRKRVGKTAVAAALGGVAGEFAGNLLGLDHSFFGGHGHGHHGGGNTSPKATGGNSRPSTGNTGGQGLGTNAGHSQPQPSSHGGHRGANGHTISAKTANSEYVATAYEHADGLHAGFNNMEHAARLAQAAHELNVVYPNPSDPSDFFYQTASGHSDTANVLKVLAKYGGNVEVR